MEKKVILESTLAELTYRFMQLCRWQHQENNKTSSKVEERSVEKHHFKRYIVSLCCQEKREACANAGQSHTQANARAKISVETERFKRVFWAHFTEETNFKTRQKRIQTVNSSNQALILCQNIRQALSSTLVVRLIKCVDSGSKNTPKGCFNQSNQQHNKYGHGKAQ